MAPDAPAKGNRTGGWRLRDSPSAYLRGAADQPIGWHPWGEEAFEAARVSGRPILLDIGASWCHWCHVMDEGTYSDPEVARLLGEHFVAVKVDRDEHPEIDRRYQRQVGALTGEGGWPLTAFLTPEGEVFLGGTYFPPTDQHGRPGLRRVLAEVARRWAAAPEEFRGHAARVREALARMAQARPMPAGALGTLIEGVGSQLRSSFDPVHGGFGLAPKFPHPTAVSFLLWEEFARGSSGSGARAKETLERMADGGMYDHVGGGFHRYSVDEAWHIPHFEKMAIDNAALLGAYVEGAQRFSLPRMEETILGTVGWVRGTLGDPDGGFGASQDADNAPGDDGSYYTWSRPQLRAALEETEFRLASRFFGVGGEGRMPHDPEQNVLYRMVPIADAASGLGLAVGDAQRGLDRVLERLRAARSRRPAPAVDRALHADLNGAMALAFARAGAYLGDPSVVGDAERTVDRFLRHAYRADAGVAHRLEPGGPSGFGLLEDQVQMARAATELAGLRARADLARTAGGLLRLIDREFRGEDGLLRDVAPHLYDGPKIGALAVPAYPLEDSPHLSANSGAALAFLRYGALVHDDTWREKAGRLLDAVASRIGNEGLFAAGAALAAGIGESPSASVVVEGTGPLADALERAARRAYHPNLWVFRGPPPAPFARPEISPGSGEPRALLCVGTVCRPPFTEPEALVAGIRASGRPSAG